MNWLSGILHGQGFGALWRPQRFSDDPAALGSIAAKGRRTCFEAIEGKPTGPHSTGDGFTAVDPFLLVSYSWGNGVGIDMPRTRPNYTAFARTLVQQASVAAALAAEGVGGRALAD